MALIDDRGRVFGKINLIDFALIAFVALLVPLGFGAYVLFRTPPPQITGITPNPVTFKSGEQRVRVTGEYLRPFMKASLGQIDARAFLVERSTSAELVFVDLPVGTYDLVLFDSAQEIARRPNALTVVPPPAPPVQIVGRFVGANADSDKLVPGSKLGDRERASVEIVSVAPPQKGERHATLRTPCDSAATSCVVAGSTVEAGKPIALRMPGSDDTYTFVVDEARVDSIWAEVQVRVFGIAEVLDLLKPGDIDRHSEPDTPNPAGVTRGIVVASLDKPQPAQGILALNFSQSLPDLGAFQANTSAAAHLPLFSRTAVFRVPVRSTPAGWRYRDEPVRTGSGLTLETTRYLVRALILRVTTPDSAPPDRHDR
jgi:hypothetical protein